MHWGVRIPLRDGICLHAILYLPKKNPTPAPAIFTLTPYIGQKYHDEALYFAAHGYPFLAVDVRGRGNSEGVFRPFINEAKDGFDVVAWLARQPYCNGKVAMWGGSYMAYDQWTTATEFPPHLATIVPVAPPYIGIDVPIRNGISPTYTMQWLTAVSGRTSQTDLLSGQGLFWGNRFREWLESGTPFKELDTFLGNPSPVFQEWVAHPQQDDYWDRCNPTAAQYAKLSIPILTITGIYDGDQPGALMHYREHLRNALPANRARHYLVIGPWEHGGMRTPQGQCGGLKTGSASRIDFRELHRQWYAWTMQGGPKPEFLQKNVAYYILGAEKWRYADTLEAVTSEVRLLFLHSTENPVDVFHSGSLRAEPQERGEPDHYVYDPRDVGLAALESTVDIESVIDQRLIHAAVGQQLLYHGAPFEQDIEVSGFFRLSAWLAIDQPDTDFRASIWDVDIDGSAVLLSADWIRARYRQSPRVATPVATKEPLRYDFERFTFVSRLIRRGHRLRLVIGPINSIYSEKNYNSGGVVAEESMRDARPVTVKLFHDQSHPSALFVPIGQQADLA